MAESKYYYITEVNTGFSSHRQPQLVKWNKQYYVSIYENVEFNQYIYVDIEKSKVNPINKPQSSEYEKVRPILKGVFLDHYLLAIRLINEKNIHEGEFYLLKRENSWYQVEFFSTDKKYKVNISIDFRDFIDNLMLSIDSSPKYGYRPYIRKNGSPIEAENFKIFLNLTLKFLYDPDSYITLLDDFIRNFYSLVSGNKTPENLILKLNSSDAEILKQLEERKSTIEKRLIEFDNDTGSERMRLRGEIEGLNYAIKLLRMNSDPD